MKKKDILCAVDFSESSLNALKWAFELARKTQARIVIMYCYRLIAAMEDEVTLELKTHFEDEAMRKFKEFEKEHLIAQPVPYNFIIEVGFYHFRIEMFLRKNPVGLVVLGNSVVQNFDEYKNLGFEKFLKTSKVPVVVVPHECEEPMKI